MLHRFHNHHQRRSVRLPESLTLADLQPGEQARVCGLYGGQRLIARLMSMGITPGVEVALIHNAGIGPLIACVREARIALGRAEARQIQVALIE